MTMMPSGTIGRPPMANIRAIDMLFLEDLLEMQTGYVLDFKDRTFSQFFAEELNIDIDDEIYQQYGTSKGKRLRCFLQTVDKPTVVRTLLALWEYRDAVRQRRNKEETVNNAHGRLLELVNRLQGTTPTNGAQSGTVPQPAFNRDRVAALRQSLFDLSLLEPHPRGYAFEAFLKELFDTFGLQAREAFRLQGEQIDGSFYLSNDTYLLEAKWQNLPCNAADLRAFNGKVEEKAAWSRGLFISNSGFSEDGIAAFGRGKRVICMDGLDLHEALTRELPLNYVLDRKVRRAAETGMPFVRVRDLFPT